MNPISAAILDYLDWCVKIYENNCITIKRLYSTTIDVQWSCGRTWIDATYYTMLGKTLLPGTKSKRATCKRKSFIPWNRGDGDCKGTAAGSGKPSSTHSITQTELYTCICFDFSLNKAFKIFSRWYQHQDLTIKPTAYINILEFVHNSGSELFHPALSWSEYSRVHRPWIQGWLDPFKWDLACNS